MRGTNHLAKKIFLSQFKIVQNFTIFVRSAPVEFPSKIKFSKNCLKLWRITSFDEGNKSFSQKKLSQFKIVQNFTIFVKFSKIKFSKNCLKLWRITSFDEGNKSFSQKIFSYHNLR